MCLRGAHRGHGGADFLGAGGQARGLQLAQGFLIAGLVPLPGAAGFIQAGPGHDLLLIQAPDALIFGAAYLQGGTGLIHRRLKNADLLRPPPLGLGQTQPRPRLFQTGRGQIHFGGKHRVIERKEKLADAHTIALINVKLLEPAGDLRADLNEIGIDIALKETGRRRRKQPVPAQKDEAAPDHDRKKKDGNGETLHGRLPFPAALHDAFAEPRPDRRMARRVMASWHSLHRRQCLCRPCTAQDAG